MNKLGVLNSCQKYMLVIILSIPVLCSAETKNEFPSSFPTVKAMIEQFSDYHEENGTFKVIKQNPLHIQLSPKFVDGENGVSVNNSIQMALIYGIYRSFVFTHVDEITVTVVPKKLNTPKNKGYLDYKVTVSKTRDEAFKLVRKYLNISSWSDLVTEIKVGNTIVPYQFTEKFKDIYHDDPSAVVRRNFFVAELSEKKK
jgi:hypothetical protein